MSTFTDLEKDAASVDGFVSENGLIPTRRNGPKPSYQYLVDGWNAEIAATILELNKSRGFRVVGTFADGFTYELFNDVGIDADGNSWIYVGAGAPNKVVPAGTVPSVVEGYQQVTFNSASSVANVNGGNVQDFIDSNLEFNTVDEMKLSNSILSVGTTCETVGYYTSGDGGSSVYYIKSLSQVSSDGDVIDELGNHTLGPDKFAVLKINGRMHVSCWGADPSGVVDSSRSIRAAVLTKSRLFFGYAGDKYKMELPLYVHHDHVNWLGLGATLFRARPPENTDDQLVLFAGNENILVQDIVFDGRVDDYFKLEVKAHNIAIHGVKNAMFSMCESINSPVDGFYINRGIGNIGNINLPSTVISENITLEKCKSNYNTRQGLSIISCNGVIARQCEFSYTGAGSSGGLSPTAGIDLERNSTLYPPTNVDIIMCNIIGNQGAGVIVNLNAKNTTVESCYIADGTSYGFVNSGSGTSLKNTVIKNHGRVSRPSILNSLDLEGTLVELEIDNVKVLDGVFGAIEIFEGTYTKIRNSSVIGGNNYGLRLVPASAASVYSTGVDVDGLTIEGLSTLDAPTAPAYIFGTYSDNVIMKNITLNKGSGSLERGMDVLNFSSLECVKNINVSGDFDVFDVRGLNVAVNLSGNKKDGVLHYPYNRVNKVQTPSYTVASGERVSLDVLVDGSRLGDLVSVSMDVTLNGANLFGYLRANGVVEAIIENNTSSEISIPGGNITAVVRKPF